MPVTSASQAYEAKRPAEGRIRRGGQAPGKHGSCNPSLRALHPSLPVAAQLDCAAGDVRLMANPSRLPLPQQEAAAPPTLICSAGSAPASRKQSAYSSVLALPKPAKWRSPSCADHIGGMVMHGLGQGIRMTGSLTVSLALA